MPTVYKLIVKMLWDMESALPYQKSTSKSLLGRDIDPKNPKNFLQFVYL